MAIKIIYAPCKTLCAVLSQRFIIILMVYVVQCFISLQVQVEPLDLISS